jgi:hypothetical protein
MSSLYKQNKISKVDISLKQLSDLDTTNALYNDRLDNIRPNQILTSTTNSLRKDVFRFKYLTDLITAGSGVTITDLNGIITISASGGPGTGITTINTLTGAVQTIATGTAGTDFAVNSIGTTHTLDLPIASALNTGKLSSADWSTFNAKAPTASPTFTGNPTAPTPSSGDNDTSIATTAFVTGAVQQALSFIGYFGAGTDGDLTLTATLVLTSDMFYNDLTIGVGGSLNLAGYRIFVKGTLDLTNAGALSIYNNGQAGTNGASTSGGLNLGTNGRGGFGSTVYGWFVGGNSATGKNKGGPAGSGGSSSSNGFIGGIAGALLATEGLLGGAGGSSGKGGDSALNTGGAGVAGQTTGISVTGYTTYTPQTFMANPSIGYTLFSKIRQDTASTALGTFTVTTYAYFGGGHGSGGGGGAANTFIAGRGGGAGGGGGGTTVIFARNIVIGASTNAESIAANGGTGGSGGTSVSSAPGGGGAGAGGGGFIYLVVGSISGTAGITFASANGGTGGAGGNALGAGNFGGQGGSGGYGGKITVINLATNSVTVTNSTATAAATATLPVGTAGTAGTAGATCTYSS